MKGYQRRWGGGRRWRVIGVFVVLGVVILGVLRDAESQACDAGETIKRMLDGDLEGALRMNQQCIDDSKSQSSRDFWGWYADAMLAYDLCVRAQLYALMGKASEADRTLRDAEATGRKYEADVLVQWLQVLEPTKGFILEKRGLIAQAKTQYAQRPYSYSLARLAVLALSELDLKQAVEWAGKALAADPKSATAYVILGAVAEKQGSVDTALERYERALNLIAELPGNHQFLPIYYVERDGARDGLRRLRSASRSPRR